MGCTHETKPKVYKYDKYSLEMLLNNVPYMIEVYLLFVVVAKYLFHCVIVPAIMSRKLQKDSNNKPSP